MSGCICKTQQAKKLGLALNESRKTDFCGDFIDSGKPMQVTVKQYFADSCLCVTNYINHRQQKYTYDWGGIDDGTCVSVHALGGCGGMLPQKNFKIRCSEIASEAIFVLKFIFELDAARIPGPSVFGAPLAMFRDR